MVSKLDALLERGTLADMLRTFHALLRLPVQVLDRSGKVYMSEGSAPRFCRMLDPYRSPEEDCALLHARESERAAALGDSYVFACPAGLAHIAFPLIYKGEHIGAVLAGPFLMDGPDAILMRDIAKKFSVPEKILIDLFEESASVSVISPEHVNNISRLLYYLFSGLIQSSMSLLRYNQDRFSQQARISEAIQAYKGLDQPDLYPYEKEKELLSAVKTGQAQRAKALLNDLLGYVFFSRGRSLENIRLRALELCSLLSRASIEGGAAAETTLNMNDLFFRTLQRLDTLEQMCTQMQEMVELFCSSMFEPKAGRGGELVKKAAQYMASHYTARLTLEEVAGQVHLNPTYFSSIFKQMSGSSFKEYLNWLRVEEAKRLLLNTSYTVLDIAIAVGFEDQGYFSKVFKKACGLSPKQFRR